MTAPAESPWLGRYVRALVDGSPPALAWALDTSPSRPTFRELVDPRNLEQIRCAAQAETFGTHEALMERYYVVDPLGRALFMLSHRPGSTIRQIPEGGPLAEVLEGAFGAALVEVVRAVGERIEDSASMSCLAPLAHERVARSLSRLTVIPKRDAWRPAEAWARLYDRRVAAGEDPKRVALDLCVAWPRVEAWARATGRLDTPGPNERRAALAGRRAERVGEIVEAIRQGASLGRLRREFGLVDESFFALADSHGLPRPELRYKIPPQEIERLADTNASISEIDAVALAAGVGKYYLRSKVRALQSRPIDPQEAP